MKKVCIFVGSRANYSSIKSVMQAVKDHNDLELQVVTGASAILERFGNVDQLIRDDGFIPNYTFHNLVEGENPVTMAKSTGLGLIEMSMILNNLKPDIVVLVGDRFEVMAVAIAAAYMNIPIAHTMGGEVTGTIDESIRHAITKFAHYHFPANEDAKERLIKLGEDPTHVYNVGCPRMDLIRDELNNEINLNELFEGYKGVGEAIDFNQPFLLVSQHPVTTEFGDNRRQIEETLNALNDIKMPTVLLWPNADAGSDDISKGIRSFRETHQPTWLQVFKNLPTSTYIHLMNQTQCLVGNSSSGVREGAFIGTPVVNIGTRQNQREQSNNVIDVDYNKDEIENAIRKQMSHGKYASSTLYGDGTAGKKIAHILATESVNIQKTITY
tara:strand:- start:2085 stop:3236 length:1152 start_codon:yes stop_codon:yes gene_type:complete